MKKDKITSATALILLSSLPFSQMPVYAAVEGQQSFEASLEEFSAECEVLYKAPYEFSETIPKDPGGVGVRLSPVSGVVEVDNAISFTVDTGGKPFTVDILDPSVASVTVNGNVVTVTGLKEGAAVVIVSSDGKSMAYKVTVTGKNNGCSDLSTPCKSVLVGGTIHLALDGDGPYTIEVAGPSIIQASIADGSVSVTGLKEGSTTITIVTGDGKRITYEIAVIPAESHDIKLSEASGVVEVGDAISFTVDTGGKPFTVGVSDPTVAEVSFGGNVVTVTGLKEGKAVITITCDGKRMTYGITVTRDKVQTGDSSPIGRFAALLAMSGFGLCALKKRERRKMK